MAIHASPSNIATRPHALKRGSTSASTERLSADDVREPYTSSSEVGSLSLCHNIWKEKGVICHTSTLSDLAQPV